VLPDAFDVVGVVRVAFGAAVDAGAFSGESGELAGVEGVVGSGDESVQPTKATAQRARSKRLMGLSSAGLAMVSNA